MQYFLSWRPYKLILARLAAVHDIHRGYVIINTVCRMYYCSAFCRSITWLKAQFQRLGLSRRGMYAPDGIIRNCIKVCKQDVLSFEYSISCATSRELRSSNNQCGYRTMWKILRDKYFVIARR